MHATAMRPRTIHALLALALTAALMPATAGSDGNTLVRVVVAGAPGGVAETVAAAERLGARIARPLPIVDGFVAEIAERFVPALEASAAVRGVSRDAGVAPMSLLGPIVEPVSSVAGGTKIDGGLMSSVTRIVGAQDLWARGITGKGVDVAVIDTGIAAVPGLPASRIVNGPDLSFDYQVGAPAYVDAFGHGTHMAGIIAGRDATATTSAVGCAACYNSSGYSDPGKFVGIAPDARLVNVKVGAFDGSADVSQVIAAIDWVVQHRKSGGLNIRVLNLSYGTDSTQDRNRDPLVFAVEAAWRAGIFVSIASGNDGTTLPTLANPAQSRLAMAVGAIDPQGSLERNDDRVPSWAQRGTVLRHVDLVAPGASIQSLAVPGSYIATYYPSGVSGRFLRGSGTSQAAAVASGVAALLIQRYPTITPDQLKSLLGTSAYPLYYDSEMLRGHGLIDASRASLLPPPLLTVSATEATGTGSLEAARGTAHVGIGTSVLTGERDIFGAAWNGKTWAAGAAKGVNWSYGKWNGRLWSGSSWSGTSWKVAKWTSVSWSGQRWSGQRWSSMVWDGQRWSGVGWNGQRWSGSSWEGQRWSGQRWSSLDW